MEVPHCQRSMKLFVFVFALSLSAQGMYEVSTYSHGFLYEWCLVNDNHANTRSSSYVCMKRTNFTYNLQARYFTEIIESRSTFRVTVNGQRKRRLLTTIAI
jgi:hypothetical protein